MVLEWDVGLAIGCNHTEGGVEHARPLPFPAEALQAGCKRFWCSSGNARKGSHGDLLSLEC